MKSVAWLSVTSVVTILGGIFFWASLNDSARAGQIGDYASAVVSALAFLWFIAGFWVQGRELSLQREQLALQREELKLQRTEMARMTEQATLGQVATMLNAFDASVPAYGLHVQSGKPATAVQHLARAVTLAIPLANATLRGTSTERLGAYNQWSRAEGVALQFLAVLKSASQLYASNRAGVRLAEAGQDDAAFIVANLAELRAIPHVQMYVQQAEPIAQLFDSQRLHLLRVRLAGWIAMREVIPDAVRPEAITELEEKIKVMERSEGAGQ